MKRDFDFYRLDEKETLEQLGLKQQRNSGSSWIARNDGVNDHILAEMKSTDQASISIKEHDILKLEHEAIDSNKLPLFVTKFNGSKNVFILVRPEIMNEIVKYLETGKFVVYEKCAAQEQDITELETNDNINLFAEAEIQNKEREEREKYYEEKRRIKWRKR